MASPRSAAPRALSLAFFLSGCSGLIYETVWVRMLNRYLGSTTQATATVLIVFMAGLALGSYISSRICDGRKELILGYAVLELLIGLAGVLASFAAIEALGRSYLRLHAWLGDNPSAVFEARVLIAILCLLPPSTLMGATLPMLTAWLARQGQHLQAGLGWLYAVNTYGAVLGVLATGFVLLGSLGEHASVAIAAALNVISAVCALALWLRKPEETSMLEKSAPAEPAAEMLEAYPNGLRRLALATFFVSGLSALAYEVLWIRELVLLLGTSIYTFSIILATMLLGIAGGSWATRRQTTMRRRPMAAFGVLEVLIGFWAALGLLLLPVLSRLQDRYYNPDSTLPELLWPLGTGTIACLIWVFPTAWFFGMQFPVAVRCCAPDPRKAGRATGSAYAVNTAGAIAGSVAGGFVLIPLVGASAAMVVLAALNVVLGCVLLASAPRPERGRWPIFAAVIAAGFTVVMFTVRDPYRQIMAASATASFGEKGRIHAYYESAAATTVATGPPQQAELLFINGFTMTVRCSETKLITHLPYQLFGHPKRMLIICFGMGTTVRSASRYPDLVVDAVDIVPEVFPCCRRFYPQDAGRFLSNPQLALHADDGRNYLLTHPERYDVVTVDPAPPLYSAGTVNLYTKEFFQLCRSRLTPRGLFCMWVPPGPEAEMKMILKSFTEVFPGGTLWGGVELPGFYAIGGLQALDMTPARVGEVVERLSHVPELGEWGGFYHDPAHLKQLFLLNADGLLRLVADSPAITDDKPYTEFPLWRQIRDPSGQRNFDANVLREMLKAEHH